MSSLQRIIAGVVLLAGVFVVHALGWLSPLESVWTRITQTEHRVGLEAGLRLRQTFRRDDVDTLRQENATLHAELNNLVIENARLQSSIETNEELQQQLVFLKQRDLQSVPARVLGRQRSGSLTTLILDKGQEQGIQKGQAVISGEGIFIGTIAETTTSTAHVLLVTSSYSKIAVKLQNTTSSPGVLEGERDLSANVNLIPQGELVEPQTTILTTGTTEHIPEGLVVGLTDTISKEDNDLFQSANVRLLLDLSRVSIVSVIQL